MPTGTCARVAELPDVVRPIVEHCRRAVLTTSGSDGGPHAVPVTWALRDEQIVTAVDQKPKSGARLARLENIEADPRVALLFDRWDEDWAHLGWVMVRGRARIEPPGTATKELAARYVQYETDPPGGEVIAVTPSHIVWWTASS